MRWVLLLAVGLAGCTSSARPAAGASCNADPASCPAGTTCWPADAVGNLQCLPSNAMGSFGAACQQTIGQATCADGLDCDQRSAAGGTCTYYCGTAGHGCPPDYECRQTQVGTDAGASVGVCRPAGLEAGFGDDGGPVDDGSVYIDVVPVPAADASPGDSGPMQQ